MAESEKNIDPTPGPSTVAASDQSVEVDVDNVEHVNKIGSKSSTKFTENEMYSTDESDTDIDKALNRKTTKSSLTLKNVDTNVKSTGEANIYVNNAKNMYKVGYRTESNLPSDQAAAKSSLKPKVVFFDESAAKAQNVSFKDKTIVKNATDIWFKDETLVKNTTGKVKNQSSKESNKSTTNKPMKTSVDKGKLVDSQAKTDTSHEQQENSTGKIKNSQG